MSAAQFAAVRLNDPQDPAIRLGHPCIGVKFLNVFKRVLKGFKRSLKGGQAMESKTRRISRQKIALIHVAAHQLGMGDSDYRALLMGAAGVRSASDLDAAGFEAVMRRFEALGFAKGKARRAGAPATAPAPVPPQYGERWGMATPAQVDTIRGMWRTWYEGSDEASARALRHWLETHYHVTDLRFCDVPTAQKAIEGLKAMHGRQQRAKSKNIGNGTRHD
jgi:hypothetical protein